MLRGGRQQAPECAEADIHGYPTWEFGDGSRARGVQTLAQLASRSGCRLSSERAPADAVPRSSPRQHHGSATSDGPLIIDVR